MKIMINSDCAKTLEKAHNEAKLLNNGVYNAIYVVVDGNVEVMFEEIKSEKAQTILERAKQRRK